MALACRSCGTARPPGAHFCAACGAAFAVDPRLLQVENIYTGLRARLQRGELTAEQANATLRDALIQDGQGRFWALGLETGQWYVSTGDGWAPADPPAALPEATAVPAAAAPAPAPTPLPARPSRLGTIARFLGALVLMLLLFGLAAGYLLIRATSNATPAAPSPVPAVAQIVATPSPLPPTTAAAVPTAPPTAAPSPTTVPPTGGAATPTPVATAPPPTPTTRPPTPTRIPPPAGWREFTPPGVPVLVLMPGVPTPSGSMHGVVSGGSLYVLGTADLPPNAGRLTAQQIERIGVPTVEGMTDLKTTPYEFQDLLAFQMEFSAGATRFRARTYQVGKVLVITSVSGGVDTPEAKLFLDSFRVLP